MRSERIRAQNRAATARYREGRRRGGLCLTCDRNREPTSALCRFCREADRVYHRIYMKTYRTPERKRAISAATKRHQQRCRDRGVCPSHPSVPVAAGRDRCDSCLERAVQGRKADRERCIREHICTCCQRVPVTRYKQCFECRAEKAEKMRLRRAA